jgi:hypothetical protein
MGNIYTKLFPPPIPPPPMAPIIPFLPPYGNQEEIEDIVKSYIEKKELTS